MRVVAALLLLALSLPGCASPQQEHPSGHDVVFPDVHGVAIDPADPASVLVATHVGLFRGNESGFARVGETQNDLMSFAVGGDGRTFYASGHPPGGGNLGLLRSDDGGVTWQAVGAPGADFHAMSASPADPARIYAYYRGSIYRSDNGGANWSELANANVASLAAHPTQRDTVFGATTASVGRSDDGGRTWEPLTAPAAYGIAVANGTMYAVGKDFAMRSVDDGASWERILLDAQGTLAHVSARGASVVVASYEGGVWRSDDAGASWRELHAPAR